MIETVSTPVRTNKRPSSCDVCSAKVQPGQAIYHASLLGRTYKLCPQCQATEAALDAAEPALLLVFTTLKLDFIDRMTIRNELRKTGPKALELSARLAGDVGNRTGARTLWQIIEWIRTQAR